MYTHASAPTAIPEERRLGIVDEVRTRPAVRADELARRFGVSVETIRRDLLALERNGLLRRVHGGAVGTNPRVSEPSFDDRRTLHLDRKRAMGRLAASLVVPGDTLMLDVGTSVAEVARHLSASYRGIVLTNSLLVAVDLAEREGVEVRTSGGRVRGGDLACSGAHAQAFFSALFVDKAFLGSGGVHPKIGLTDYYPDEIATRRTIVEHATNQYVMADSSKLGQVAVGKVCDLDAITAVITDDKADRDMLLHFERVGVEVLVARTDG